MLVLFFQWWMSGQIFYIMGLKFISPGKPWEVLGVDIPILSTRYTNRTSQVMRSFGLPPAQTSDALDCIVCVSSDGNCLFRQSNSLV